MASSSCLMPVQDSYGCFCFVVAGFIWLLMVGNSIGCFLPVLDGGGGFSLDLWIDFSVSALI